MARQFNTTLDFMGTYIGRYDGRRAKLDIWQVYGIYPPNGYSFGITLTDLDRNVSFTNSGTPLIQNTGPRRHFITEFGLWNASGSVHIRRLFLHTWDIDYISGESVWNNTEYGFSFMRQYSGRTLSAPQLLHIQELAQQLNTLLLGVTQRDEHGPDSEQERQTREQAAPPEPEAPSTELSQMP
jgi:hypothetical protein